MAVLPDHGLNVSFPTESRDVKVVRCYVGHLMTSMDMRGIQLSFLRVDDDERSWWLHLLDAPTSAPMWPHAFYKSGRVTPDKLSDEDFRWRSHFEAKGPKLGELGQKAVLAAIRGAAEALEHKVDHLNELDSGCGDGDCGSTLGRWVAAVGETEFDLVHPHTLLEQLSYLMESKVGGTTGAIYGIFFAAAASTFKVSEIVLI